MIKGKCSPRQYSFSSNIVTPIKTDNALNLLFYVELLLVVLSSETTVAEEVGWFNSKEGGACDNIIPASFFLVSRPGVTLLKTVQ